MHVILALSTINFLLLFLAFERSHCWGLSTIKVHNSGYLVCATPPTFLYRSIWHFASPFVMVCKYAYGFGIIFDSIFITFFTFELNHFGGLNAIKVHYYGFIVCAPPPTVLYRSILNFAGHFIMVSRCVCVLSIIVNWIFCYFFRLLNLVISVLLSFTLCVRSGMVRARILKFYIQSTLFIPTHNTTIKFVLMTIWMSRNLRSKSDG